VVLGVVLRDDAQGYTYRDDGGAYTTVVRPSGHGRKAFGGSCGQILGLLFPVFRVLATPGC